MRWNRHRRDACHKDIVAAFRALGCSVRDTSQLGDDGPDLLVGFMGRDFQVELKSAGGALSEDQAEFHDGWLGHRPVTLYSVEQATKWVQETRRRIFHGLTARD